MPQHEGEPRPQKRILTRMWEGITRRGSRKAAENIPSLPEVQAFEQWAMGISSARRRNREQAQLAEQQGLQREKEAQERAEEKKKREVDAGKMICQRLEQEIKQFQLDRMAKVIQEHLWENDEGIRINLLQHSEPSAVEQENGTWKNRSKVEIGLWYKYRDCAKYVETGGYYGGEGMFVEEHTQELIFGIGYFGEREHIVEEAQGLVTDEELQEGVKGFYIRVSDFGHAKSFEPGDEYEADAYYQRTEEERPLSTQETHIFPFALPNAYQLFTSLLQHEVVEGSPDIVVAQAKERLRKHNVKH